MKNLGEIPSLNGLRAVSIIIVIWAHAGLPGIAGSLGVTVFFFISGYLITTLLRAEADRFGRISVGDFFLRRVLRIFPSLYIVLGIGVVLSVVGAVPNAMSPGGIAAGGTFFANYWIIANHGEGLPGGLNLLWSLAVEEHFYLVFPFLYVAMRRWMPRRSHQAALLVAICLLILVWRCVLAANGADPVRLYYATDTRADAILWGSVLAIGFNPMYGEVRLPKRPMVSAVIVVFCAVVFFLSSKTPQLVHYSVGFTVQSLMMFGILIPLLLAPSSAIGRVLNSRAMTFVGILSYTLYLGHNLLLEAIEHTMDLPVPVEVGLALVGAFAFSLCLQKLVEAPIARYRKRLTAKKPSRERELVATGTPVG